LKTERQNYQERQRDLEEAYGEQLTTIDQGLDDQKAAIKSKLALQMGEWTEHWKNVDRSTYEALKSMVQDNIAGWLDRAIEEAQNFRTDWENVFESHSPSRWMLRFAEGLTDALETGFPAEKIFDNYLGAVQAFQGGMGRVAQPAPAVYNQQSTSTTITNSPQYRFDVAAHYANAQSEASLRDDIVGLQMAMRSMPGRG
ncbi:MAG: hypothetical protein GWN58_51760, partial [Anaerolineae bacterium]|nr:hypothetical protein [Anaerolineae bacterium]